MTEVVTRGGCTLELNPTNHYKSDIHCSQMLGYIPTWLVSAAENDEGLADGLQNRYQFFTGWHRDDHATVENDLFMYPGDPPHRPILKATKGNETILVYPHEIVAVLVDGELVKWTRFD